MPAGRRARVCVGIRVPFRLLLITPFMRDRQDAGRLIWHLRARAAPSGLPAAESLCAFRLCPGKQPHNEALVLFDEIGIRLIMFQHPADDFSRDTHPHMF